MSPLLAAVTAMLLLAAGREALVAGEGRAAIAAGRRAGRALGRRLPTRLLGPAGVARASERIARAGVGSRLSPWALLAGKLLAAAAALPAAIAVAPLAPGRLGWLIVIAVPLGGWLGPDAILERAAAARRRRIAGALPDALDLMAVGAGAGRSARALLADAAAAARGPLAGELGTVVAEIECGRSREAALRDLRERRASPELATLAATLQRSGRHGSPLAGGLRAQATALRRDQRRAISERAARAAPKIQLVVALLLVPSVLLIVAAAILAGSDSLLSGL